ncbi:hypothetical protein PUN4_180106 [Paraburkholderia unamae]|uniref:hypothetical protein n=1 Tax=Paraburkholderia unamae TaxID=219649 RepID=UPI001CAB4BA4|nr:hypothetical protein [Paraburkholderia unamae]CAG9252168.1 hypothetical protein PUN4_180106 [Paraburkholderia unamae]
MAIQHILWVFDLAGQNTDYKTRTESKKRLDLLFLSNCNNGIESARSEWVGSATIIAPHEFDAVVFLIPNVGQSLINKVGVDVSVVKADITALGYTATGMPGGGVSEVYWDRCLNSQEVASSIFHEAAHLKSENGKMHDKPRMRVLSVKGATYDYPSWEDLEFYEAAIKRRITLRTKVPSQIIP